LQKLIEPDNPQSQLLLAHHLVKIIAFLEIFFLENIFVKNIPTFGQKFDCCEFMFLFLGKVDYKFPTLFFFVSNQNIYFL